MGLRRITARLVSVPLFIATFSYNWSLLHFTIEPIAEIAKNQYHLARLKPLLEEFKARKEQEIHFVRRAVSIPPECATSDADSRRQATLSAAAVIGCFSWTKVDESFWLGQLFWHISFWLSIFALISSAQQRLLERLPERHCNLSDDQIRKALPVLLKLSKPSTRDVESGCHSLYFEVDPKLIWVWQNPMMLMSFSWVTFLVGYELYLLTPLIHQDSWTVESIVSVAYSVH
jgi:hypothetical protein